MAFAQAALIAKYGEEDPGRFNPEALVRPIRAADRDGYDYNSPRNNLWNTYNILQEKLIEKGGRFTRGDALNRPRKAVGIRAVQENVRVNQALWALTEEMAKLKGGTYATL